MKQVWFILFFVSVVVLMQSSCFSVSSKNKLTIATAANVQFAMAELMAAFTEETGVECEMVVSSSGKLTAQIQAGAPYDVFVSANMKYPNVLFEKGLTTKLPEVYAFGEVVLWKYEEQVDFSIEDLESADIQYIAIANSKTAPYGEAAMQVLKYFNLFEKVKDKLVYGESISQTNQFIITRAADIGFTAKAIVMSPKIKGTWVEIPQAAYEPIEQGAVIIKKKENSNMVNAERFYQFLFSKKAKTILSQFGYRTNS